MDEAPVSETTALLVTLLGLQILTAVVMITGHADSAGGPVGMSAALIVIRLVKQSRVSGR
jgi:hypothetical protein